MKWSILQSYYQAQRAAATHNAAAQTTIRLLESLIRLSEAHARLMFHNEVTIQDAVVAVCIIENSMQNMSLLGCVNFLHVCFPEDPDKEYFESAKLILEKLNLPTILAKVIEMEEIRLREKLIIGSSTDFICEPKKKKVVVDNDTIIAVIGKEVQEIEMIKRSVESSELKTCKSSNAKNINRCFEGELNIAEMFPHSNRENNITQDTSLKRSSCNFKSEEILSNNVLSTTSCMGNIAGKLNRFKFRKIN